MGWIGLAAEWRMRSQRSGPNRMGTQNSTADALPDAPDRGLSQALSQESPVDEHFCGVDMSPPEAL
jgi:hypothetical protein